MPLAALLDRLGFFAACADAIARDRDEVPVLPLWVLAAATTAVLNLDTTIVLLTPLYVRLARNAHLPATGHDRDPTELVLGVAVIPLLLAAFASSFLPVSNLTTIILAERTELSSGDVLVHLGPASLVACTVGWFLHRRRHPTVLRELPASAPDATALRVGGAAVVFLLVGFVAGPYVGVDAWVVALVADLALAWRLRHLPWRRVPVVTAAAIAALSLVVSLLPDDLLSPMWKAEGTAGVLAAGGVGAGLANVVNNLPAALVAANGVEQPSWPMWSYLLAINVASVLVPIGAVANLLWWRILRDEGVRVDLRRYLRLVAPVAVPTTLVAVAVLALQQVLAGGS